MKHIISAIILLTLVLSVAKAQKNVYRFTIKVKKPVPVKESTETIIVQPVPIYFVGASLSPVLMSCTYSYNLKGTYFSVKGYLNVYPPEVRQLKKGTKVWLDNIYGKDFRGKTFKLPDRVIIIQ